MKKAGLFLSFLLLVFFMSCSKQDTKNIPSNLEKKIVCFGDSLTYGKGAQNGKTYPYFLQEMTKIPVINLGVSGNTSLQALDRIDEVIRQKAFMIIIEFGANDFFQQVDISQTRDVMTAIVDKLKETGAIIVLVSTEDAQLSVLYHNLKEIAELKQVYFIDGILNDIWADRKLFADDLHPNSEGYKIVAEKIYQNILPIIEK